MEHYKIFASFEDFFLHLKSGIQPTDKKKVSILHKTIKGKQEIFISTEDDKIREVISEKFEIISCKSPYELYKKNEGEWEVRGNASLIQDDK